MFLATSFFIELASILHPGSINLTCVNDMVTPEETYQFCAIPAILLSIGLSFITIRKGIGCLGCDSKIPGAAIPMNFIQQKENVFLYVAAFGVSSYIALNILEIPHPFTLFENVTLEPWAQIFVKILGVLVYGVTFYPILASIYHNSIVSFIIGSLYTTALLVINSYNIGVCSSILHFTFKGWILVIFKALPLYTFCTCLVVMFIIKIVKKTKIKNSMHTIFSSSSDDNIERNSAKASEMYVRHLLQNDIHEKPYELMGTMERLKYNLGLHTLRRHQGISFPTFFVCSVFTCLFFLYVILYSFILIMEQLSTVVQLLDLAVSMNNDTRNMDAVFTEILQMVQYMSHMNYSNSQEYEGLYHYFTQLPLNVDRVLIYSFELTYICFAIAIAIATVINVTHLPFIMINYKFNMLEIFKGKYTQISRRGYVSSNSGLILGYSRFAGYQVAYYGWGYILQIVSYWLVITIIAILVYIPIRFGFGQIWIALILEYWPVVFSAPLLMIIQAIVTKVFFTQGFGATFAIENRNAYFIWVFFMYFYNIFLGIVSVLLRILKGAFFGVVFMSRIDHAIIAKKFEFQDPGWMAYQSYLHVQNLHSNPILLYFITMLQSKYNNDNYNKKYELVKYRWALLYTLIRNPALISQRKDYLDSLRIKIERNIKLKMEHHPRIANDNPGFVSSDEHLQLNIQ